MAIDPEHPEIVSDVNFVLVAPDVNTYKGLVEILRYYWHREVELECEQTQENK